MLQTHNDARWKDRARNHSQSDPSPDIAMDRNAARLLCNKAVEALDETLGLDLQRVSAASPIIDSALRQGLRMELSGNWTGEVIIAGTDDLASGLGLKSKRANPSKSAVCQRLRQRLGEDFKIDRAEYAPDWQARLRGKPGRLDRRINLGAGQSQLTIILFKG